MSKTKSVFKEKSIEILALEQLSRIRNITISMQGLVGMIKDAVLAEFGPAYIITVTVEKTWIDYGAGWEDDQIIIDDEDDLRYQLLSPRDIGKMKSGGLNVQAADGYVKDVVRMIKSYSNK